MGTNQDTHGTQHGLELVQRFNLPLSQAFQARHPRSQMLAQLYLRARARHQYDYLLLLYHYLGVLADLPRCLPVTLAGLPGYNLPQHLVRPTDAVLTQESRRR